MKNKKEFAIELGISRKSLYNYMDELKITELTETNINLLKEYVKKKNKTKDISKTELLEELEKLKITNAELIKQNETLQQGQDVLLQQIEYYQNSINSEIMQIKESLVLLLPAPKKEKKRAFFGLFRK